jgi:hypothetical protein
MIISAIMSHGFHPERISRSNGVRSILLVFTVWCSFAGQLALAATATVTLSNLSVTYNGHPQSPTVTTSPPNLPISFNYTPGGTTAPTNAGSYTVVATINDATYQGSATSTFQISKAALTVTADNKTRFQGSANPPLTVSYSGFVNGESELIISALQGISFTAPSASTTAVPSSPVGSYPISLSGGSTLNYTFNLQSGTLTVTSTSPSDWISRNSGTGNALSATASNGSAFVAVGNLSGPILTSSDGIVWTSRAPNAVRFGLGAAWGGGKFVVVGDSGAIVTSLDGISWTNRISPVVGQLASVVWNGSQFVAVGGGPSGGTIITSPDGIAWTGRASGTATALTGVAWGGGLFVAIGNNTVLTSSDGVRWNSRAPSVTANLYAVTWGTNGFVAVGEATSLSVSGGIVTTTSTGVILTSPDGISWTSRNSGTANSINGVTWNGSEFVAVGGAGTILTSLDGISWTSRLSRTSASLSGIAWGGNIYVVVGSGGTILTAGVQLAQPVAKVTQNLNLPPLPTLTPSITALPKPELLATQFSTFYSANRGSFDPQTQSYFDAARPNADWMSNPDTKKLFLKAGAGIKDTANAVSVASMLLDLGQLTGALRAGTAIGGSDAYTLLSDAYDIDNRAGVTNTTVDHIVKYVEAAVDVGFLAAFALGAAPEIAAIGAGLGLVAIVYGDFIAPQLTKFGQDPPDPNFTTVVVPQRLVFGQLPTTGDAQFDALIKSALQSGCDTGVYVQAANQTVDKYAGALNAGSSTYATVQMEAFLSFMASYNLASQKASADAAALSAYMKSAGMTAPSEASGNLALVQQKLRTAGFSQAALTYYGKLGLTDSQIEERRQIILGMQAPAVPIDLSFSTQGAAALLNQATSVADSKLINLSVRTSAGSGDSTLIAGFAMSGQAQKSLLVRAIGPTLLTFGVGSPLPNPRLDLYSGANIIQTNNGWQSSLASKFSALGAFSLPIGSKDSALSVTLGNGSYTAQVVSNDGATGIALVEIYDDSTVASTSRLTNISARSQVGSGAGILIAGFVIGGNSTKQLLIRAVGPSLGAFGVGGTLVDPKLQIFQSNTLIAANDDWGQSSDPTVIQTASQNVGAFALPMTSKDSVLLVALPPGSYTAQVSGVGGTTGVALVEIYDAP